MAMKYDEAIKAWGWLKLKSHYPDVEVDRDSIAVEMEMDEGYSCCGGSDPNCYCSLAESPSMNVKITGHITGGKPYQVVHHSIPSYMFDFVTVLKEIVEAGDGEISV